ncbi:MAG: OmpA family protein [Chitinophagales bacterium]|nr:OmpA family protein [Chitinophagales bacterium]
MKTFILILTGILFHFSASAIYLKGFVLDKASEKPIAEATIQLMKGSKVIEESTSSENGSFIFDLKKNKPHTLLVSKEGYRAFKIVIEDNRTSIPLLEVYLEPMKAGMYGKLISSKGNNGIAFREVKCLDLESDKLRTALTDGSGNFFFDLSPNSSYRVYFNDAKGNYSEASAFVSTVGKEEGVRISRKLVATPLTKELEKLSKEEMEKRVKEEMAAKAEQNEIIIDEAIADKYSDSTYVVNKHVPLISFNKKKQNEREEELETIYFYAQLEKESGGKSVAIKEEIIEKKIGEEKEIVVEKEEQIIEPVMESAEKDKIIKKEVIKIEEEVEDKSEVIALEVTNKSEVKTSQVKEETKETINESKLSMNDGKERRVIIKKSDGEIVEVAPGESIESISTEGKSPAVLTPRRNTVYFAKAKSFLTDETMVYLDKYAERLVKNPKMKMTISSHTDSDIEYTIEKHLAKLRAESVMSYLMEKGVIFEQLEIRIVGNTRPVNGCLHGVECTEEQHKMNRRVELIFEENKPY